MQFLQFKCNSILSPFNYIKENFNQANCVTSRGRKTGWAPSLKLLGGGDRVPENSK